MQVHPSPARIPPNPKHVRQAFWQIWFPLVLVIILVIAAGVLSVVFSGRGGVSTGQWTSIAIVWMILPLIVVGILFLLFTIGMIYLVARILKIVPVYTRLAQVWTQIFNLRVTAVLDRLASPLININGHSAGWKAIWKRVLHK